VLLAQTANPEAPYEVNVSQPSDVLTARATAAGAFNSLFLAMRLCSRYGLRRACSLRSYQANRRGRRAAPFARRLITLRLADSR
jgi:hypothetical protein